ncbi:14317_t:CDS:2 [Cetraspora pellucida]|uniref:14317_t:CDS:1 n=1 Tax=Cetraspora pellucida TaxID=1433469 RepID=A0A9N9AEI7_9GLOM|nr:14317_t:CDS:2 [Cetraspora pellucida]
MSKEITNGLKFLDEIGIIHKDLRLFWYIANGTLSDIPLDDYISKINDHNFSKTSDACILSEFSSIYNECLQIDLEKRPFVERVYEALKHQQLISKQKTLKQQDVTNDSAKGYKLYKEGLKVKEKGFPIKKNAKEALRLFTSSTQGNQEAAKRLHFLDNEQS